MSKRLQVLLEESEMRELRRLARRSIFVDSNVPMYLVGADHPNKVAAQRLLERAIAQGERLVTDVEVLQEILHRYVAIARRDAVQPAFDALLNAVDEVFAIELRDVEKAKDLLQGSPGLSGEGHFMDTIGGGKWLPDQELAWKLVTLAIERIHELENELGCFFDRNPDGTIPQKTLAGQT